MGDLIKKLSRQNLPTEIEFSDSIETFKDQPRFKPYVFNYDKFRIHLDDPLAFYWETRYIFDDAIYYFETKKSKPLIIDGGASIGVSTLYFKNMYPEARILAFEPDLNALKYFRQNITDNNLNDIEVIERGLFNKNGAVSYQVNETDSGKITTGGHDKILVTKLSDHLNESLDFLKLNIEGAELAVCQDLDKSGKIKLVDQLCIEWHSFAGESQNLDEVLYLLKKNGFRYYIASLSTAPLGRFTAKQDDQYYLMIYARRLL